MRKDQVPNSIDSETQQILDRDANDFARDFGVDPGRVRAVLARMVTQFAGVTSSSILGTDIQEGIGRVHMPKLTSATNVLGADAALRLFGHTDLVDLARRLTAVSYLTQDPAFLTLEELASQVDIAADQLSRNRTALVATGLPPTVFGFGWLWQMLTYVYPIKMFQGLEMIPIDNGIEASDTTIGTEQLEYRCIYTWRCPGDSTTEHSRTGKSSTRSRKRSAAVACSYEEAPLIKGLDQPAAKRLEVGRPVFMNLAIRVLHRLALALRSHDGTNLWPDCLKMITDAILASDAAFYLEIDRLYTSIDVLTGQTIGSGSALFLQGGLSNLVRVIGHCEKELTTGTLDRTRRALPHPIAEPGELLRQAFPYYRAVGQPWQAELDRALDQFWALEAQEAVFWEDYRIRVNAALENEFYAEVVTRTRVKQKLVAEFEPLVTGFAEAQRAYQEASGAFLPLHLATPPVATVPVPSRFQRTGNGWRIRYEEQEIFLKDTKGLCYLAYLLKHPGREFPALELVRLVDGVSTAPQGAARGFARETGDDLRVSQDGFGDAGPLADEETRRSLKRRLNDIDEEMEDARTLGNTDRVDELQYEKEEIAAYLAKSFGLSGRIREAASAAERARVTVTKAIRRAERVIAETHPSLAAHLRYVNTGRFFSYIPPGDRSPRWEF